MNTNSVTYSSNNLNKISVADRVIIWIDWITLCQALKVKPVRSTVTPLSFTASTNQLLRYYLPAFPIILSTNRDVTFLICAWHA